MGEQNFRVRKGLTVDGTGDSSIAGNLGIGTTSPATKLHIERSESDSQNLMLRLRDSTVNTVGDRIGIEGYWNTVPAGDIEFELTDTSSGASAIVFSPHSTGGTKTEAMRIASNGYVGIGDTTPSSPLTIYHAVTNPALDGIGDGAFAMDINIDLSGSGATGGDREQGGLYIDLDTTTTGGDTGDEHRPYGIWVDARQKTAADADALYGIYGYTESERSSASTSNTTNQIGVYGYATSDETADNTITNLHGVRGDFSLQDNGVVSNTFGLRTHGAVYKNRNANLGAISGVAAEVQIDGGRTSGSSGSDTDITTGNVSIFKAVFDHNVPSSGESTVSVTNSYLYYGNSSLVDSGQVTNNFGVYMTGETKNYFSGKVGIGTTSPNQELTVEGTISLKEQADANADTAAYGQIWVNTATPNELWYTTDAGDDIQLTSGTGIAGSGGGAGLTLVNGADDRVVTASSGTGLNGESTLTFDGSTLALTGSQTISGSLTMAHNQKIYFDSTDTYIYADADSSEDLHIGADGHIELEADTDTIIKQGSTELARFTSTGLGIGTTAPAHDLDVASNANPTIFIRNTDAAHAADDKIGSLLFFNAEDSSGQDGSRVSSGMRLVATDAYGRGRLELTAGTSDPMGSYAGSEVYTDNSIARLSILTTNGNVGIGTTTPRSPLHIKAPNSGWDKAFTIEDHDTTNYGQILYDSDGLKFRTFEASDAFYFRNDSNTTNMIITDAGNVGIGNTAPAAKLDIIEATGAGSTEGDKKLLQRYKISGGTGNQIYESTYHVRNDDGNTTWTGVNWVQGWHIDNASPTVGFQGQSSGGAGLTAFQEVDLQAGTRFFGHGNDYIMTIDGTNDRVGIGTTSPDYALDVAGAIGVDQFIYHNGDSNTYINMSSDDFRIVVGNDLAFHYDESGSSVMHLSYNGEADVKIANGDFFFGGSQGSYDGKMGIGEATPGSLLEIRGATTIGTTTGHIMLTGDSATNGQGPQIVFSESGSGSSYAGAYIGHARTGSNSMGDLIFGTRATGGDANTVPTEKMRILANGRVGIGDSTPSYALDVVGDIHATGQLLSNGNIRSGSRLSLNTMTYYHFDRQSVGTNGTYFLRVPVGGSSNANRASYFMPLAGNVMVILLEFYGQTLATSGTDTWRVNARDPDDTLHTCDFNVNFANLVRVGTQNNYSILCDVSALDDAIDFAAGAALSIQRDDLSPIDVEHVAAQIWVTFDA